MITVLRPQRTCEARSDAVSVDAGTVEHVSEVREPTASTERPAGEPDESRDEPRVAVKGPRRPMMTARSMYEAKKTDVRHEPIARGVVKTSAPGRERQMILLRQLLGDVLRRLRVRQGRTLREVSTLARVSLGYLSEVERGQKEASSELLASICGALGVPLSQVLREVSDQFALAELQAAPVLAEVPEHERLISETVPGPIADSVFPEVKDMVAA